jgi:hypothetical protein
MDNTDHIKAHDHSFNHLEEIRSSDLCGCFYCLKIFHPSEIKKFLEDEETVLCPYCEMDSVIGSNSGYPITEKFLGLIGDYWFSLAVE